MFDALRPGGTAIIGVRNALMGLFSLNRFSWDLFSNDIIPVGRLRELAEECGEDVDAALDEMQGHLRMDMPPNRGGSGPASGYDDLPARMHNPLALAERLRRNRFRLRPAGLLSLSSAAALAAPPRAREFRRRGARDGKAGRLARPFHRVGGPVDCRETMTSAKLGTDGWNRANTWGQSQATLDLYRRRAGGDEPEMVCIAQAADLLADVADAGDSVLDIGCGTGHLRHALTARGMDIRYTGIDPTASFIETGLAASGETPPDLNVLGSRISPAKRTMSLRSMS